MCFWSIQGLEIINSFTYGGVETAQYPLPVFAKWFRNIFIYFIPLGCVSYFPALALMDRPDVLGSPLWFRWASPLMGVFFLVAAIRVWRFGVRRYKSTGS